MAPVFRSMTVRILICLEISLLLTSTMAYSCAYSSDGSTKRFCGRVLTDSLALICEGEYETIVPMGSKRSDESFNEYAYNDQAAIIDELPIQYQTYAYLSKLLPDSAGVRPRSRREWITYTRHGVYDECCRKPCSFQELKSYCKRKD